MKILLVEDEKELALSIKTYLSSEKMKCEAVESYASAIEKLALFNYDLVLLDISLPDGNGLELLKELKKMKLESGVLIISAKSSLDDKVEGLDIGADDYLVKPFQLAELNSRIKAIIRRKQFQGNNRLKFHEFTLDLDAKSVCVHGKEMLLTPSEYEILLFFIANKNRVLTKESIAEHIWGDIMEFSENFDFVYTHIRNLRKKISDLKGTNYIQTVYSLGYKFVCP